MKGLGRRTFLGLALTLPLAGLIGCGGGGGDTTGPSLSTAKGRIVLPSGATLKISEVANLFGKNTPLEDGTFNFPSAAGTPLLTSAYGSSGEAVLYGFLSDTSAELSARSTAVVLAYFVLGVGAYPAEVQALYLTEITRSASLTALETAVAAAIRARGEAWLAETDKALVAALEAVQSALSAKAFISRGVILDKTDRVSGLQVQADGIGSMTITNFYRRRSYAYVDRVSYKVKATNESVDFKGLIFPQPLKITPVKGVSNTLANLGQLLGGQRDFYEPVVSSPVSIPVNPSDAASTTYTATAVGIGVHPGDFGKLTPVQQDGWWEVTTLSILLDLVAPVIAGVVIPNFSKDIDKFTDFMGSAGVLKDITNAIAASKEIRNKAQSGKIADAAWDTLLLIAKSDTLKNLFLQLVGDFIEATFPVVTSGASFFTITDRAKFLAASSKKLLSFVSKLNIGLQVFDTVTTGFQLANCNQADVFTLEVTNATARLNPDQALASPIQAAIPFTAAVANADVSSDTLLSYQWSCACKFGDISDGHHTNTTSGTTFDSSSKVLSYIPNGKGVGGATETVTVKIFKGGINKRVAIGTATSVVTFVEVKVTPTAKTLKANESVTLTTELKGMRPLKPGETIAYKWLTTRNAGELLGSPDGGTTIPVETPTATYRAHATKEGVDTVTVEAYLGTTRLGSAKAKLTVGKNTITVAGRFHVETTPNASNPGFTGVTAVLYVPKIEGGKSYSVYAHGFNDTAYYGTSYRASWTMPYLPSGYGDRGTEFVFGLSGGESRDPDVAGAVAYLNGRFAGMVVDVTVTL